MALAMAMLTFSNDVVRLHTMARRKNTRLTHIYWLVDVRPEILAIWPQGLPFYCGKTVLGPEVRLAMHKRDMARHPNRPCASRLRECGEHVRVHTVEIVSANVSWAAREKFWIWILRGQYPDCVNVSDGGQGAPGHVHTDAARAKMSASRTGKSLSAEHRAATSAGRKGIVFSDEQRANMRAAQIGKKQSAGTIEKKSAACRGQKRSLETRARISAALKGKTLSQERCTAMSAARLGGKHSPETRIKMAAAQKARRSAEAMI